MKKKNDLKQQVNEAILACQDKQADDVTVLELEKDSGAFTDYFVMCSGTNPRQIQAIADAVDERLEALGLRVTHTEGYKQAEWVLLDYVDFVVHIFSEKARQFYDLERLWKSAKRMEPAELLAKPKPRAGDDAEDNDCQDRFQRRPKGAEEEGLKCPLRIAAPWSSSYRLVAAEKWKAKSAVMGNAVTEAFVEYCASVAGHERSRSGQRHGRAGDQSGAARWSSGVRSRRWIRVRNCSTLPPSAPGTRNFQTSRPGRPTRTMLPFRRPELRSRDLPLWGDVFQRCRSAHWRNCAAC